MSASPYLFRAADHPLTDHGGGLKVREGVSPFGVALRYQERAPRPDDRGDDHWCHTGHSVFVLSGRISYTFDTNTVEAGPGDMLHIPAGPEHRHIPRAVGTEVVKYVLTEFG